MTGKETTATEVATTDTPKSLILWEEAAKRHRAATKALLAALHYGPKFVTVQGGILSIDGVDMPDNTIEVIIVAKVGHNIYYDRKFDPSNPAPPACYAFYNGSAPPEPHENVAEKVSLTCVGCPMKEWGSDTLGDRGGRACKDSMRVALLPGDVSTPEEVAKAEIRYYNIPVMSVDLFTEYLRKIEVTSGLPEFAFVSRMYVVRDVQTQFKVHWAGMRAITDEAMLLAIYARSVEQAEEIAFPYRKEETDETDNKPTARRSKL